MDSQALSLHCLLMLSESIWQRIRVLGIVLIRVSIQTLQPFFDGGNGYIITLSHFRMRQTIGSAFQDILCWHQKGTSKLVSKELMKIISRSRSVKRYHHISYLLERVWVRGRSQGISNRLANDLLLRGRGYIWELCLVCDDNITILFFYDYLCPIVIGPSG